MVRNPAGGDAFLFFRENKQETNGSLYGKINSNPQNIEQQSTKEGRDSSAS
jgi:hypothetical protein